MIIAKNINKYYGDSHVLKDINLTLKQGEITVLLGPSGCGKTTLLRNLSLLDLPDSGGLEIFEQRYDFPYKKSRELKLPYPGLTVVFQQLFLWPHLNNKQNILLALEDNPAKFQDNLDYFQYLVKELHMENYIEKFPNESSLGEKQRVAIARALVLRPKIILFDEITASLDIMQIRNIVEIILKLKNEYIGLMFITHNIELAKRIGDKLIFMNKGEIIETGKVDMLENTQSEYIKQFLGL